MLSFDHFAKLMKKNLEGLCIEVQRLDIVNFFEIFVHVINSCCVTLQCQIIVIVQGHLFIMIFAIQVYESLHYFHLHIGRRESVIMLFLNMHHKLMSEPAHSHGSDIRVWYSSFYSCK
jgi:hypothetical protein